MNRIDWTPFFRTWELAGTFPRILDDPKVGQAARDLHDDAQAMLERIAAEQWLTARGVIGLFPANSVGDDIEVYADESRGEVRTRFHFLRQQMIKNTARANFSLADFVAPKETGVADYLGGFAVTAGIGIETKLAEFDAAHDDYNSILLKALAEPTRRSVRGAHARARAQGVLGLCGRRGFGQRSADSRGNTRGSDRHRDTRPVRITAKSLCCSIFSVRRTMQASY